MNDASADDALRARRTSPWTPREKLRRWLWSVVEATLFRWSPQPWYRWRAGLLRCFGARVHRSARIRQSATVEVPWQLHVGAESIIGDRVVLYCLADIRIGDRCVISQFSHLCAGTHDHTRRSFPLVRRPITIGDDVWIAADVFVGPGVTIGNETVVGARSSVFDNLPPRMICLGSPAKPVRERTLNDN